jgi:hypothetical protein
VAQGEPDSGLTKLTVPEDNLLLLLETAGRKSYGYDGSVKWALNTEDVLPARTRRASLAEWEPKVPVDAWNRAASLLGLTAEAEDCA